MEQLKDVVTQYLESDTNYALMITGEWGIGKTYYFKNVLQDQIKKISTLKDHSKKYNPILVSLFGLKSIEEIQTEIFLSINPHLKDKKLKLVKSIANKVIKKFLLQDIEVELKDWIELSKLVICFDDLERISKNLKIEEFIGYVNSLVENENIKVLIIANENKIEPRKYVLLKEKVIGNSIEFIPDISNSFNSLVETKYTSSMHYKEFLENNKDLILKIYTANSSNLRVLSFALSYYQNIFSEVSNKILEYEILKDKKEETLSSLLKFSLIISIEYKKGKITFKKREKLYSSVNILNSTHDYISSENPTQEEKKEQKSYFEKFIEKYYPDNSFIFFLLFLIS